MKKNKIIAAVVFAAAVVVMIICAVVITKTSGTEKVTADLYFINEDGTGIVSTPQNIRYRDDDELIRKIIDKLRKGPMTAKLGGIMPKDTQIRNIKLTGDGTLTVDFSENFISEDASKNVLSVYAVVKSLCSTAHVSSVKVLVGGDTVKDKDEKPLEFISASDINLETEEYRSELREVELYFAAADGVSLVPEKRTIKITDQQPIEQYIINELIKGPTDKKLKSVLSDKTVLVSADLDENICYLNFKSDFLKINEGNSEREKLVIYSIVNSLTELKTISRVQFYMDGKRVENFGSVKIKDYIERNTAIIKAEGEKRK